MTPAIRRRKLIKPWLQLKIVLTLLTTAVLCVLVQAVLMSRSLSTIQGFSTQTRDEVMKHLPDVLVGNLVITLGILIPLVLVLGTLVTFRVAGPVYRLERFFMALARGEQAEPCRLRERDELQELCALVNEATGPLLARATVGPEDTRVAEDVAAPPAALPGSKAADLAQEVAAEVPADRD